MRASRLFMAFMNPASPPPPPSTGLYNFNNNGGMAPAYFKTTNTKLKKIFATGIIKCA